MIKGRTKPKLFYHFYDKEKLKNHIDEQVNVEAFDNHCNQVAENLKIDPIIVKELLLDNSFLVLSLLQLAAIKDKFIKINITGFFSFVTEKTTYLRHKL